MKQISNNGNSLFSAFEERGRVISALIFRELKTRFGEARLGVAWVLLEPMIHLTIFVMLRYMLKKGGYAGVNLQMFLITGIIPFLFFRTTITRLIKTVDANKALLVFSQIRMVDLISARLILEITIYVGVFAIILLLFYLTDFVDFSIKSPQQLILVSLLLWFSALSAGLFCMVMRSIMPLTERITAIILMMLYFTSGVIFSYEVIPYQYREYMAYNPVLHLINLIRESFFIEMRFDAKYMNVKYVFMFFGAMFVASICLMIKYKRKLLEE